MTANTLPRDLAFGTLAFMDAHEIFTVTFGISNGAGRGYGAAHDPPTEEHTLESLGAELTQIRSTVIAKGEGPVLLGGTIVPSEGDVAGEQSEDDVTWRFRRRDVRHLALTELDHDAKTLPMHAAAAILRTLGVAAVMHPSSSADAEALKWRGWLRVSIDVTPSTCWLVVDALACLRVIFESLVGCRFDPMTSRPEALGFIGAAFPEALGGVRVIQGRAIDAFATRERAIAAGFWTVAADAGPRTYDGDALYDLVVLVKALGRQIQPGVWGLVCPRSSEHTDGRGTGDDTSAVLNVHSSLLLCSHSHGGEGRLSLNGLVKAWRAQGHDLDAVLVRVKHPDLMRRVDERFDDEPALDTPEMNLSVTGDVVEDAMREALLSWECNQARAAEFFRWVKDFEEAGAKVKVDHV